MKKATVRIEMLTIPTYPVSSAETAPIFIEKRAYQGSTGKVYPLPVTEKISDEKVDRDYTAVILENEYLYVCILPELGGRIQRAYDKTNGYDFVYYNQVIKPALVGLAGPWISGGIEFNWPQHHRPSTFSPVDYSVSENADGSVSAYIGEVDSMYGTKSTAKITLYPDKAYIEIEGKLFNPTDFPQSFLWWANPAVSVNEHTYSVFPPDVTAVMDHGKRAVSSFPIATGEYYKYDYSPGTDISRYKNIKVPTSYMAAHSDFDFIGNYDEQKNAGLLHIADRHISPGKKQWTWGCGDFGKMWDKNLTDEDGPYIELMTGVYTDNQPDFTWLKPGEYKGFTQYFMPYKAVGRVGNATKEAVIGVTDCEVRVYTTAEYKNAVVTVLSGEKEVYKGTVTISPEKPFTKRIEGLCDYTVICEHNGNVLCKCREYKPKKAELPLPADAIPAPEKLKSAEDLYLAGQHLEQYRHATFEPEAYYEYGLKNYPDDIRLNNAYGLILLKKGLYKESIDYFKKAIKKQTEHNPNPYYGECYFNLGLAFEKIGELSKAFDAFYKSVWSAETKSEGYYHLAAISMRRGDRASALEFINESIYANYRNMKARTLKAVLQSDSGFLKESLEFDRLCFGILVHTLSPADFKKAMGGRVINYLKLAEEYIGFGEYRKAVEILSLCENPNPMIYYYKAYALGLSGDIEAGKRAVAEAERCDSAYCFPNTLADLAALEYAESIAESVPMASYYKGCLLYDKKRYSDAVSAWEKTVNKKPDFAPAYRNLSIAYYNKEKNPQKALSAIKKAFELDSKNSRYLFEYDSLCALCEVPPKQRLQLLESNFELLESRDRLYLSYITLLNDTDRYREAFEKLSQHKFHVWEGGEGKISEQYKRALFGLAESEMADGELKKAYELCEKTLTYPDNLGEGKLFNVPDNKAYYYMGLCCEKQGNNEKATELYKKAAEGEITPSPVHYYNDVPSDYIYYIGLAFIKLKQRENARKAFSALLNFGKENLRLKAEYDYFAVSLPELNVYQEDMQKISDSYCKMLINYGEKGLKLLETDN